MASSPLPTADEGVLYEYYPAGIDDVALIFESTYGINKFIT